VSKFTVCGCRTKIDRIPPHDQVILWIPGFHPETTRTFLQAFLNQPWRELDSHIIVIHLAIITFEKLQRSFMLDPDTHILQDIQGGLMDGLELFFTQNFQGLEFPDKSFHGHFSSLLLSSD
jgi:hypothetical protein